MSNYNLTDNVNESFEFSLAGVSYTMRYPLVEEIEKMQDLVTASQEAKKKDQDTKELDEEINDWMYSFIDPVKADSAPIKEAMKKQNVKVLQNFQTMFKTEFGIE